jgi:hypothetical protein
VPSEFNMSFLGKVSSVLQEKRAKNALTSLVLLVSSRTLIWLLRKFTLWKILPGSLKFYEGSFGFFLGKTYFTTNNAGLLSCASTTLHDLAFASRHISKINSRLGMGLYKQTATRDNWQDFFQPPRSRETDWGSLGKALGSHRPISEWWEVCYDSLPIQEVSDVLQNFFTPSSSVQKKINSLIEDYSIRLNELIGVHYRGTDKEVEISTPPIEAFIFSTRKLLSKMPLGKVLLLTDEPMALSLFLKEFPGRVIHVSELRMSNSKLGAHTENSKDKKVQGQIFFATLMIISRCSMIVTHTGNGALWEVLFRGSSKGVIQIRSGGPN